MDNQQPSDKLEWRIVKEYNRYEVNQNGEIRHINRRHILKPQKNKNGYVYVTFNIQGQRKHFAVHRIVANAFVPNPLNLKEVNHKDYNKENNCANNLEWISSSANKIHAYKKEQNHYSRSKKVEQYSLEGILIKTFNSITQAAQEMNCCKSAISNCCLGRTSSSQGFRWKFVEGSTTKYRRNPVLSARDSIENSMDEDIV